MVQLTTRRLLALSFDTFLGQLQDNVVKEHRVEPTAVAIQRALSRELVGQGKDHQHLAYYGIDTRTGEFAFGVTDLPQHGSVVVDVPDGILDMKLTVAESNQALFLAFAPRQMLARYGDLVKIIMTAVKAVLFTSGDEVRGPIDAFSYGTRHTNDVVAILNRDDTFMILPSIDDEQVIGMNRIGEDHFGVLMTDGSLRTIKIDDFPVIASVGAAGHVDLEIGKIRLIGPDGQDYRFTKPVSVSQPWQKGDARLLAVNLGDGTSRIFKIDQSTDGLVGTYTGDHNRQVLDMASEGTLRTFGALGQSTDFRHTAIPTLTLGIQPEPARAK